jgi:hypothetical protein
LKRAVSLNIEGEGKKRFYVKYEKVPFFCKHCGLIGHNHEECGDGVWGAKDLQYGDFMFAIRRATPPVLEPRPLAGRGRGSGPGRAPQGIPRKRSSQEAALDDEGDLKDDAVSPIKPAASIQSDDDIGARRNLDFSADNSGSMALTTTPMESVDPAAIPPPPPPYTDPRERSKLRKMNNTITELATSAASFEEDRQAQ